MTFISIWDLSHLTSMLLAFDIMVWLKFALQNIFVCRTPNYVEAVQKLNIDKMIFTIISEWSEHHLSIMFIKPRYSWVWWKSQPYLIASHLSCWCSLTTRHCSKSDIIHSLHHTLNMNTAKRRDGLGCPTKRFPEIQWGVNCTTQCIPTGVSVQPVPHH